MSQVWSAENVRRERAMDEARQAKQNMQLLRVSFCASTRIEVVSSQSERGCVVWRGAAIIGRVHQYGYLKACILADKLPPWLAKHTRRDYIIRLACSTPEWRNKKELNKLSKLCDEFTMLTGHKHVLDHIIPISHPYVCGLTVHNNMRVIDKVTNQRKGNSLNGELNFAGQIDLF